MTNSGRVRTSKRLAGRSSNIDFGTGLHSSIREAHERRKVRSPVDKAPKSDGVQPRTVAAAGAGLKPKVRLRLR
jgi:hypothetical protein